MDLYRRNTGGLQRAAIDMQPLCNNDLLCGDVVGGKNKFDNLKKAALEEKEKKAAEGVLWYISPAKQL